MKHDQERYQTLFASAQESAARLANRPRSASVPITDQTAISFEFFPPVDAAAERSLWECIERLAPLAPRFVSVTYGAGGTTRERTHNTVTRILEQTPLAPAAHLTCVGATRSEVDGVVDRYRTAGVNHIVALRGDPPAGTGRYVPHPDGYADAAALVAGIAARGTFDITVAAYPEVHPESRSAKADLDNLKRKIDAGATRAITQFFFDNSTYLRFLESARAAGITIPIIPGILPVTNFAKVVDFAARCGTSIPPWLAVLFDGLDEAADIRQLIAATVAAEQCTHLREQGIRHFHFYTLNRPALTLAICHILGVKPTGLDATPARKAV